MCLQWCHVRNVLLDNDLPCERQGCPESVRLAHAEDSCSDCIHFSQGHCTLTHERPPQAGVCCHWNVAPQQFDAIVLRLGENVPQALLQAHGVSTVRDLFDMVDSAPDLPPDTPADGVWLSSQDLVVPLVYGICAACWEQALSGVPDAWCHFVREESWS